ARARIETEHNDGVWSTAMAGWRRNGGGGGGIGSGPGGNGHRGERRSHRGASEDGCIWRGRSAAPRRDVRGESSGPEVRQTRARREGAAAAAAFPALLRGQDRWGVRLGHA